MSTNSLKHFLSLLNNVKKGGNEYTALCPAHDDHRNSLSVNFNDGKILLYCHVGCTAEDICRALGIEMRDLFEGKRKRGGRGTGGGEIVATYDYRDENGSLLFEVCRTASKSFFQRRPDGRGSWINGLGGVKPVLYRLPELLAAVKCGDGVFIPEGEKDVENLVRLGLAATTNPMGAGKWRDYYSDCLKGATCVILPDNDEPGKKHAEQVARSLSGKAASVKVLELPGLPAKGDVTSWLAAGGTHKELLGLAVETPEWVHNQKRGRQSCSKLVESHITWNTWNVGTKAKKRDDENKTRQASFFVNGETLFEQVYVDGKSMFVSYDAAMGETMRVPNLELEEEMVEPLSGEDVVLGAVKLPSGVEEYGDTLNLLAETEAHINRYLDVSPSYQKFAAYYVLLSWLYDRFSTLPYLRALGDTGCGKSRFLDVIGGICYKSISASGCVTPAPIYRMLRKWGGTLVLDEADMKNSDEFNEVVTILNCGFEKGRPVLRATKDNPDKIQVLPVYGPKVFATRRRFRDVALEARCLTEIMHETDRDDIPPVLGRRFIEEQHRLRNKLLLFRLRNYFKVDPEAGISLNLGNVEPRLKQVSESFLSLFAMEEKVLESYRSFVLDHQRELIEQRAATKVGQVVEALFELLDAGVFHVPSVPSHMGDSEHGTGIAASDIAEKTGLTFQAVGAILKGLGLETKRMRQHGQNKRVILHSPRKLEKLRRRYILPDDDDLVPNWLSPISLGTLGTLERRQDDDLTPCKYCGDLVTFGRDAATGGRLPMRPDLKGFHKCKSHGDRMNLPVLACAGLPVPDGSSPDGRLDGSLTVKLDGKNKALPRVSAPYATLPVRQTGVDGVPGNVCLEFGDQEFQAQKNDPQSRINQGSVPIVPEVPEIEDKRAKTFDEKTSEKKSTPEEEGWTGF